MQRPLASPLLLLLALFLALLLAACPSGSGHKASASTLPPCAKFGDRCEFSPGKLGSCVVRDGCTGSDCFVCQSQH